MFNNEFWGFWAKPVWGCLQLFLMNIKYLPNQTKLKCSCTAFLLISKHLKHHFGCHVAAKYVAESHSNNLLFWHTWVVRSTALIHRANLRCHRAKRAQVTLRIEYTVPPLSTNPNPNPNLEPSQYASSNTWTCGSTYFLPLLLFLAKVSCILGYLTVATSHKSNLIYTW